MLTALTPVRFHTLRPQGRDFVVGDLHGCLKEFMRLLNHVGFHMGRDRVFSVGDLTDRGPNSWGCLRLLKMPWFFACFGNHEARLLAHLRDPVKIQAFDASWLLLPGGDRLGMAQFAAAWMGELEALPAVHVVGQHDPQRFNVVHAELLNDNSAVTDTMIDTWAFADSQKALERATYGRSLKHAWEHDRPTRRAHDRKAMSPTYCGHSIMPQPSWLNRQAYIDGGAFLGHTRPPRGQADPLCEPDEMSGQFGPATPGVVLVEPRVQQAWLAPTGAQERPIRPLTLATLELR